jgi:hypothetical protein
MHGAAGWRAASRQLREDDPRRGAARDGRRLPRAGRRSTTRRSAFAAMQEVGPGGHFFGAEHTQSRYRTAFHKPMLSDWRNYETWQEAGSPELPPRPTGSGRSCWQRTSRRPWTRHRRGARGVRRPARSPRAASRPTTERDR